MINIPTASFRVTPCGEVDAAALEKLRNSFDTSQLLDSSIGWTLAYPSWVG